MVERTQASFEEFTGEVVAVTLEDSGIEDANPQFHLKIAPTDVEVKGKTGLMHEWIPRPRTTTETSVPEGSVIDRFLQELEMLLPSAKKATTVEEAMNLMIGKTFFFKRMKHGRSFQGKEAKEYWTPKVLKEE